MEDEKPDAKLRPLKPEPKPSPLGNLKSPEPTVEKPQELPPPTKPESEYAQGCEDGKQGIPQRSESLKYKAGYEAGRAIRKGKA